MKRIIKSKNAPEAIGPYSQAIAIDNLIFTAGQIAIVPETGKLVEEGITEQTEQVFKNLKAIIAAAGSSLSSVVKTTVYLTKPDHFAPMNEVYAKHFTDEPPARTTIFVSSLPKGGLVEIEAIAKL